MDSRGNRYDGVTKRLSIWLALGGAVVLALMLYITFFDVVGRFVFNRPLTGSVEVIALLMGMLIYLGVGLVTYEGSHIRVDVLTQILPPRLRAVLDFISHLLSLGIVLIICWRLWVLALDQTAEFNETQVLGLPVWATALIMAVCSLTFVTGMLVHLRRAILNLLNIDQTG